MSKRYRMHDSQRSVASELRRNTAINPRYWIIDQSTGQQVDAFTERDTARVICKSMNDEHDAKRIDLSEIERIEAGIAASIRDAKYSVEIGDDARRDENLVYIAEYAQQLHTAATALHARNA